MSIMTISSREFISKTPLSPATPMSGALPALRPFCCCAQPLTKIREVVKARQGVNRFLLVYVLEIELGTIGVRFLALFSVLRNCTSLRSNIHESQNKALLCGESK